MSVYNFRDGPSYTAATREEMFTAAMDMPMNFGATFWDQAKGGTLESFALGTGIRGAAIPPGDTSQLSTMDQLGRAAQSFMPGGAIGAIGGAIRRMTDEPSPVLSEDAYKSSPFFRDDVPWDASMTEDRAAALASWHDAKAVRQYFATKRPITAFLGSVAGQAFDPINYIPVIGPAVQAAAAARTGRIIGTAATASADAALNTAIAGMATSSQRAQFGDDVSWQATITEIATAALIGAAFGGIVGGIDARRAARVDAAARDRLATLQTAQEARIALNEGIDALARGEDVNLSPNATAGVERIAEATPRAVIADTASESAMDGTGRPTLSRPIVLDRMEARQLEPADGTVFHGSPFARDIETDVRPSEGGELGAGVYISREPVVAAGYARNGDWNPSEGVLAFDATRTKLKDVTRAEYLADRSRLYDEELVKAGGEWSGDVARAGDKRLIEFYKEQGFDGIYDVSTRQGVVFPDRIGTLKLKRAASIETLPVNVDASPPRPEPIPEGRAEAEKTLTRTDDYAALKAQYRVDPETGDFLESAEIDQLRAEGRLTDEDIAALDAAQAELDNGTAYGDALKAAVACII